MLLGKPTWLSMRWLLALTIGFALAIAISMAFVDDADAAPLNQTEQFLVNKKLWFEYDWDRDGVCYLYDIRKGTSTVGPYLQVVKTAYYVNPFTGQCRLNIPSTIRGGVGQVNKYNVLKIRWPQGYVEGVSLLQYHPAYDALAIRRSSIGDSWWQGCNSPDHPFC